MADQQTNQYDLIVLGAGPAGEKGAAQAAYFGKRVALVEQDEVGGTAVNTGTLPSKTLRETALYLSGFRQRGLYGVEYNFDREVTVDDLIRRERDIVRGHQQLVGQNIGRHGIELFHGAAALEDAHTVRVAHQHGPATLRGDVVLIATGSRPFRPPEVPFDGRSVYDSDDILHLKRIPSSLIVIGGGVVGCEYATLFAALGIAVTLIDGNEQILPFLDREVAGILVERMGALGIFLRQGRRVAAVHAAAGEEPARVSLSEGDELRAEAVLFSGGRSGNTERLGLERLGVLARKRGLIDVNERFQTSVPNIYASGDVIGSPALASTAMEEARVAVCHAFGFEYKQRVSGLVPQAVYTIPEVSMVGETEEALTASGQSYLVGRASYRINPRAEILGDTSGLVKLLFDPDDQRVLGVHVVGEQASELIHLGQACMHFGGTLDFFIQTVFNFPTLSDLYKYAAYDGLGRLQRERE